MDHSSLFLSLIHDLSLQLWENCLWSSSIHLIIFLILVYMISSFWRVHSTCVENNFLNYSTVLCTVPFAFSPEDSSCFQCYLGRHNVPLHFKQIHFLIWSIARFFGHIQHPILRCSQTSKLLLFYLYTLKLLFCALNFYGHKASCINHCT